jgi:hypothetical protein
MLSFTALSLLPTLLAQFGPDGIKPNSEGIFAPGDLEKTTVLTYTNTTISFLVTLMTTLGGLFFLYNAVMAGIYWLSAGGEQKKIQEARDRITQSVLGLIVLVFAYGLAGLIGRIVGIDVLNPAEFINRLLPP